MCEPVPLSLVIPIVPFRDTPAGLALLLILLGPCVGLAIRWVPHQSLDAPENLTGEAPCQVALGKSLSAS